MNIIILLLVTIFSYLSFLYGRSRIRKITSTQSIKINALPNYYGYYLALWCALPALIILLFWSIFEPAIIKYLISQTLIQNDLNYSGDQLNLLYQKIRSLYEGNFSGTLTEEIKIGVKNYENLQTIAQNSKIVLLLSTFIAAISYGIFRISKNNKARHDVEKILTGLLFVCSLVAILTTMGIIFSLLFESLKFFSAINIFDFLFGMNWSPQRAFVSDASAITALEYENLKGAFGSVPLFAGTAFIALIAMLVAVPIGLFSGIYMAEYASSKVRKYSKPIIEILAGIPTVVYGFFAALTVGPFFRELGEKLNLEVSSESALAAGLVMGVMIIPYVSSLSDDVINAVPQSLRDGSYAIGATKSETIKNVVIPAALPGIVGSVLLAVSRAIGETMIVVMAAGLAANLTINPLESTTTITTQIVMLLIGDQEFDSPKTQSAFALGLTLFFATLILNYIALRFVKKYREKYE
ncbi:phosphate ABC transporter permease subunit PstC [Candidatus Pelagibacter ubique]|jgi:phosphate transport system permease protein|uniref:Phosphate transport system permease protein n=1 Tax=Pelagibacter ubique (strain HTCC1062) TaxID=335992 RepID=Q4FLF4_PELUB|nr:phosphate ABC transporter permease subunit PstC [Candidatus Pelagibacter ubique]MDG2165471.1 phosphate ABC transporter permease subunit PstC [Alphaproteobacteria bacterium]AAZ21984.1 ABC transporter [Candidatus Pelagibacter ubique HTCC1062]MDA7487075.1 phosphate ABC transporter permease subunit PstC [Candidatus Pelagibacter ubique]MDA8945167.1 phosphate ABC transporter permease subunit PstC [Candidatus Pelagibacter ubique]MDA9104177.1 phosphate ABC transporter permease subunit PstC [Candida|tara:strand:- start:209 stop:1609 length:1401 start_codon:yes stop_codon:yes gene_type:complete